MSPAVRILFAHGAAEWMVDEGAWRTAPGHMPAGIGRSVPNIEEWESFWLRRVSNQVELDARDLCFDGDPVRGIDWAYRGRRWISLRGRGPPTAALPDCYSVVRFDEGWVLFDDILGELVFLVASRTTH